MAEAEMFLPKGRNDNEDLPPMLDAWQTRSVEREQDYRRGVYQGTYNIINMLQLGATWYDVEDYLYGPLLKWRWPQDHKLEYSPPPEPGPYRIYGHVDFDIEDNGFTQFPCAVLPEPIRSYVSEKSLAIGCDLSMIALPMLASLAAAIGNTRRIQLKDGWCEPSVLWTAVVCDSGQRKTPAVKAATSFLETEEALSTVRYIVSDVTREGLAGLLAIYPRGLLLSRDELAGWLSFGEYKKDKGGDVAFWLSRHSADTLRVDRKARNPETGKQDALVVPVASCSVTGGIQPGPLRRALGQEYFENGLAARLLLAYPPKLPRVWNEGFVKAELVSAVTDVFHQLVTLEFKGNVGGSVDIPLTESGQKAFVAFYNRHGQEMSKLPSREAALWSKLEGGAARLALIVHCVRVVANDSSLETPDAIDGHSIACGVTLADWFGEEGKRIYEIFGQSPHVSDEQDLIAWIRAKGGTVTVRDVYRGIRRMRDRDTATRALAELVTAGQGEWIAGTTEFKLLA
jgi:hypothetical protein